MSTENEKLFRQYIRDAQFDDTLDDRQREEMLECVLASRSRQSSAPSIWSRVGHIAIARKVTYPLSASIAIAAALFVIFGPAAVGPESLYAQAMKAWEESRTLHMVVKDRVSGNLQKRQEMWYDREKGIASREYRRTGTMRVIDNGKTVWRHKKGADLATKTASHGAAREFMGEMFSITMREDVRRYPKGDREVDGFACRMYIHSPETKPSDDKGPDLRVWIDEENRVRLGELCHFATDPNSFIQATVQVRYDVAIDAGLFRPNFGPEVTVIDAEKLLGNQYELKDALAVHRAAGLVFAVHKAERLAENLVYVVCSTRVAPEYQAKLPAQHPHDYFGELENLLPHEQLKAARERKHCFWQVRLARQQDMAMSSRGLLVKSFILIPAGTQPDFEYKKCEIVGDLTAANRLEELLKADKQPTKAHFSLQVPVQEPAKPRYLEDILLGIYSASQKHESLYTFSLSRWGVRPGQVAWQDPTRPTQQEYVQNARDYIAFRIESFERERLRR